MKSNIKVCPDCEAVYHNCNKSNYCFDCGGTIKTVTYEQYGVLYLHNIFQYDYQKIYQKTKKFLYIIKSEPTRWNYIWSSNDIEKNKYWEDQVQNNKLKEVISIYGELSKEADEVRELWRKEKIKHCDKYYPNTPKYKYGITNNINQRLYFLQKEYKIKNIEIVYLKEYYDANYFEKQIKYPWTGGGRDYDEDNNKKEWFGEEESEIGGIRTLDHVLKIVNEYNELYPKKIVENGKCIISEELKSKYNYL